jgi:hypothetical protein
MFYLLISFNPAGTASILFYNGLHVCDVACFEPAARLYCLHAVIGWYNFKFQCAEVLSCISQYKNKLYFSSQNR